MLESTRLLQQRSAATSSLTAAAIAALWRRVDPDNIAATWDAAAATDLLERGKLATAEASIGYVEDVLAEVHDSAPMLGQVSPSSFAQLTADGRPAAGLMEHAVPRTLTQIGAGVSAVEATTSTLAWLMSAALTELSDTKRGVIAAQSGLTPTVVGYTRVLTPPSCGRCIILAGKRFKWNDGFQRHPRCDCAHVPTATVTGSGELVDPYAAFDSLSRAEQDRLFGAANAEAIRNGADIYRVENARLASLSTTQRKPRKGQRYSPDELLEMTKRLPADQQRGAFRTLLERNGYITGPQVAGGVIRGNTVTIKAGQSAQAAAERAALAAGRRDLLNRQTMTSAERELFDATFKLRHYERYGVIPRTVGANSADRGTTYFKPSADDIEELRERVDRLGNAALNGKSPSLARLKILLDETDADELIRRIEAAQTATVRSAAALGRR